jgi:hypothetical protein
MTNDEAAKIATLIATADNGCANCADALAKKFTASGFGFRWFYNDDYDYDEKPMILVEPAQAGS